MIGVCSLLALASSAYAQTAATGMTPASETDRRVPIDYGYGPGVPRPKNAKAGTAVATLALTAATGPATPVGGAAAATEGVFAPVITWPIIPIHTILLPDGRVLSYGTDQTGKQSGQFVYDVWNPAQGTSLVAHTVLPNATATDIFCSGQSLLGNGEVLITGGDRTINNVRNYSTEQTEIFSPATDSLRPAAPMAFARWYPSLIALPNDEMIVLGGRLDRVPVTPTVTPEIYNRATGWRTLTTANSDVVKGSWYYPRAFLAPNGRVFILAYGGGSIFINPAGTGAVTPGAAKTFPGTSTYPMLMYAPGKLLSVRTLQRTVSVDLNVQPPKVVQSANIDQERAWSNLTVLADGKVLLSGGSAQPNVLNAPAYAVQIWNPATGQWTRGASAAKPRLYHSSTLLLPDGSVLTGGGGAPGPVKHLNAEIYYPPYLYRKDGSGQPADRPVVASTPGVVRVGQPFEVTLGTPGAISRVTLVRAGSATHSYNPDQRFLEVPFTQTGTRLALTMPGNANVALPGFYMLFVFDAAGVPSVAPIVQVRL
jgi:hypothetical protein